MGDLTAEKRASFVAAVMAKQLEEHANSAYQERDRVVALAARMAMELGHTAWLGRHDGADWDDEWRNIVFIALPTGQVSWHIHDDELELFEDWLPRLEIAWDGHSTSEKYHRVNRFATGAP